MEAPLEIRYAGVVIGRAQEVRSTEGDALSFFIPMRDPMPVGTVLRMRSGDQETPVRVVQALEAADATVCGMQVKTIGEAEVVALEFIPPPAAVGEKLNAATPTPEVEVDLSKMRSESVAAEVAAPALIAKAAAAPAPAAKVKAAKVKSAETTPVVSAAGTSGESAAVPDAVPVAVASSMTGALRNATESVPISMPIPEAPTVRSAHASDPASLEPDLARVRNSTQAYGSVVEPQAETVSAATTQAEAQAEDGAAAAASGQPTGEDLPPARPITGPSGRRKTRRRK